MCNIVYIFTDQTTRMHDYRLIKRCVSFKFIRNLIQLCDNNYNNNNIRFKILPVKLFKTYNLVKINYNLPLYVLNTMKYVN